MGIILVKELFGNKGNLCSYEDFMRTRSLPVKYKVFASVTRAVQSGIIDDVTYSINC